MILSKINGVKIPESIEQVFLNLLGKNFDEGSFFDPDEIIEMNSLIKGGSKMENGIFFASDGEGMFLLLICENDEGNIFRLSNGDQGYPEKYEYIGRCNENCTELMVVRTLNRFYENYFGAEEIVEPSEIQLKFKGALPNGLKDLLVIKSALNLEHSIADIKKAYSNGTTIKLSDTIERVEVNLRFLNPLIVDQIEIIHF